MRAAVVRLGKKLALSAAVFVASLVLAEAGFRGWLVVAAAPYDARETERELGVMRSPTESFVPAAAEPSNTAGRVLHPFYGSELHHDTGRVLEYFRRGLAEREYTILVLGGSVAAQFASGWGDRFVNELTAAVPYLEGKRVRILNGAHAAYKQPQQLNRLTYLLSFGYEPDAVILLDGFNEVADGIGNGLTGYNPVYPGSPVWAGVLLTQRPLDVSQLETAGELLSVAKTVRSIVDHTLEWNLHRSSVLGTIVLSYVRGLGRQGAALQGALIDRAAQPSDDPSFRFSLQGPPYEKDEDALADLAVTNWFEASRSIHALCRDRGIVFLHVLQPALFDEGSKPRTEREEKIWKGPRGWELGAEIGYPRLRERGEELVALGVPFVDGSRMFAKIRGDVYLDACHVNPSGNDLLTDFVLQAFVGVLVKQ